MKKIIAVAEDDVEVIRAMERFFAIELPDCETIMFYDGSPLHHHLLNPDNHVDIIVSDNNMIEMDGDELCTKIQESDNLGHRKNTPFIFHTGDVDIKLFAEKYESVHFVAKYDTDILLNLINNLLNE